ncbi:MAG TPA: hypothetical protein VE690_22350 [Rhodopila sp.]|nr:hypothetical protein [Rhodopila sp.]
MTYVVVRLYTASGPHTAEQILHAGAQQLAPQIARNPGLLRYTLFEVTDQRFGSATLCIDRDAAQQTMKTASDWVGSAMATQGARLDRVLQGERFFAYQGTGHDLKGAWGDMRIFQSPASVEEWHHAIERDLKPLYGQEIGLMRVTIFKSSDLEDTYVVLGAFTDHDSCTRLAQNLRAVQEDQDSVFAQITGGALPEVTESTIFETFARSG